MAYPSLASFLDDLARDGQLVRVAAEVDADGEIAEIARRQHALDGPALLFENVHGREAPVVTGLFGTTQRICRALEVETLDDVPRRVLQTLGNPRRGWIDRLAALATLDTVERFRPKAIRVAPSQQVVQLGSDIDLARMPALRAVDDETHPSLTSALLLTHDPKTGERAINRGPLAIVGPKELAVRWDPYSAPAKHLAACGALEEKLPVAVAIGGPPATMLAAQLPAPPGVDPLAFAGLISGAAVGVVGCRTHEVETLAEAEIVIEGYIDPQQPPIDAGQLAGPAGFFQRMNPAHAIHVTAVTQRTSPVFAADVVDDIRGMAATTRLFERFVEPFLQAVAPDVVRLAIPTWAPCDSFAIVAISKQRPHQAHQVAGSIWGFEPLMHTKTIVVVDETVDASDERVVLREIAASVLPGRDVVAQTGPTSPLDQATAGAAGGQKLLIDATAKFPEESRSRLTARVVVDEKIRKLVDDRFEEYGLELPGRERVGV